MIHLTKNLEVEKLMENRNYNIFFGKKVYDLANINNALTDLKNGKTVRPLIAS